MSNERVVEDAARCVSSNNGGSVVDIKSAKNEIELRRAADRIEFEDLKNEISLIPRDTFDVISVLEYEGIFRRCANISGKYDIDLVKFICSWFSQLSAYDEGSLKKLLKENRIEFKKQNKTPGEKRNKQEIRVALRDDYYSLWRSNLGTLRRDIFSGAVMYQDHDGIWKPALNEEKRIRAEAHEAYLSEIAIYDKAIILPYLLKLESELSPELIVDIPEWDGRDRIQEMCSCITLKPGAGVTTESFEQWVKDWLASMFRRLQNPEAQNRIIVLKGVQGLGKDSWINALIGGLGQWAANMNVVSHDKDTYLQLSRALVLKIAEFDRTSKAEASLIKDLITTPNTFTRAPYDHAPEFRSCRCSFIATCNVDEILKDSTGNRRFLIFEVDAIKWDYDSTANAQMQILAQARELSRSGFRANEQAREEMSAYLEEWRPVDTAEEIEELWNVCAREYFDGLESVALRQAIQTRGWFTMPEALPVLERLKKHTGYGLKFICAKLKVRGLQRRNNKGKGYALPAPLAEDQENLFF